MAALILLVVATLVPAGSAGAQPPDDLADAGVSIVVDSVSPWVDAEGTWSAALQVIGAPADAKITYSVRQPPVGTEADVRDALARSRDGEDEPKVMRAAVSENLADVTDAAGTTTLQIAIRSGSGDRDRVKIPNSGVYPVVITVASADGTALERTTLFLNRLPAAEDNDAGRYRVGHRAPTTPVRRLRRRRPGRDLRSAPQFGRRHHRHPRSGRWPAGAGRPQPGVARGADPERDDRRPAVGRPAP
jgi:hypothetical protein